MSVPGLLKGNGNTIGKSFFSESVVVHSTLKKSLLKEEAPRHLLALYVQKDDFARQSLYYLKESEATPWNPFDNKDKVEGLLKAEMSLNKLKVCEPLIFFMNQMTLL